MPDIKCGAINDPGMSAVWCILPGLQADATGVVDINRRFARAFVGRLSDGVYGDATRGFQSRDCGAWLTDMISMYN